MKFEKIALKIPNILLPNKNIDMRHWSVIACDQYTSDRSYWQKLQQQIGDDPSCLNLIFPEVYLNDNDNVQRIEQINKTMEQYLADGTLVEQAPGCILLERKTAHTESRKGLIVALDLDEYDYHKGAKSLIRATEGTILDRLPPRIKVRQNAPIELPHIMVLIDDPQQTVIEPLFHEDLECVYDFDLIENGGHLCGYRINQPHLISQIAQTLEKLADPDNYRRKYQVKDDVMLYAMGDGNHSFATAKALWEQIKAEAVKSRNIDNILDHPARYALVELVNLHDPGLEFEPIHRVLFSAERSTLLTNMENYFTSRNTPFTFTTVATLSEAEKLSNNDCNQHCFPCIIAGEFGLCSIKNPKYNLVVATLQAFLDHYLSEHGETKLDYIHGSQSVTNLGSQKNCAGFYLPALSKHALFKTIIIDGALPRKTFSMGEADEKRFYLECRSIKA
ncbi:MAG: hypothetical protein B6I36_03775 [Desulfobacteraceae bacterium 4572_35.1]|nr:MAG: hypothetical protein B6I36_03775 [Desulfobacteraceae bacterium 4572_35.1]